MPYFPNICYEFIVDFFSNLGLKAEVLFCSVWETVESLDQDLIYKKQCSFGTTNPCSCLAACCCSIQVERSLFYL